MPNVAVLNTVFSATSDKFGAGTKSAIKHAKAFEGVVGKLNGVLSTLGVGLSVAGIGAGIKAAADSIDNVAKSADRIGIGTRALSGFQLAADLAGSSAEQLDNALLKMQRNLSDAASGGGAAAATLKEIGLDARALVSAGAEQSFLKIADAISNIEDPAKRVSVAMDIFGKSGAQLLNTLAEGSGGLQAAIDNATRLGIAFDRIDAVQVEAANDAITELTKALRGAGVQLAISFAGAVTKIAQAVTNALVVFREWAPTILKVVGALAVIKAATMAWRAALFAASKAQALVLALTGPKGWLALAGAAAAYLVSATLIDKAMESTAAKSQATTAAIQEQTAAFSDAARKTEEFARIRDDLNKRVRDEALGLSPTQSTLRDLEQTPRAGLNPDEDIALRGAIAAARQLDQIEQRKKREEQIAEIEKKRLADIAEQHKKIAEQMQRQREELKQLGDKLKESTKTPLQEFETRMAEIRAALEGGEIDITTARAAKLNLLQNLAADLPDKNRRAGALEFGTREAFSAQSAVSQVRTEKEILEEVRRQSDYQRALVDHFAKTGEVVFSI